MSVWFYTIAGLDYEQHAWCLYRCLLVILREYLVHPRHDLSDVRRKMNAKVNGFSQGKKTLVWQEIWVVLLHTNSITYCYVTTVVSRAETCLVTWKTDQTRLNNLYNLQLQRLNRRQYRRQCRRLCQLCIVILFLVAHISIKRIICIVILFLVAHISIKGIICIVILFLVRNSYQYMFFSSKYNECHYAIQSVSITSKVVSSNSVHGEVYSIQHYVLKFVSDLWQVVGFLRVLLLCL
jgi:hypothetical protein